MKIPASYHQERLWFIDKFEAGYLYDSSPVYHNVPLVLEIKGALDTSLLEQSIRDVIHRHEVLRSQVLVEEDKPIQQVEKTVEFSLSITDLEENNPASSYHEAMDRAVEEINKPFIMNRGLLIRGTLIRFKEQRYILVVTLHHIICDRFSMGILLQEIFSCYKAYKTNQAPGLPGLALHYPDFSQWQRQLPVKLTESLLGYWKKQLAGKLQALEMPTDRPRAHIHTYRSKSQTITLSKQLVRQVRSYSKQLGAGNRVTLLAAFELLLSRYSGYEEIVVGTSADNRGQRGLERVIGPISNLLVLREFVSKQQSFDTLAKKLDKTVKDAFAHQSMPFDKLVLELNPDVDMSRTALFDVLFQYEENPFQIPPVDNLEIQYVETNLGWGKYDLNLLLREQGDNLSCILVYNSDIFDDSSMIRMLEHYRVVLERALENPAGETGDISLLTGPEKEQLLSGWNRPQSSYPKDKTIHRIFEEQVEQYPDNIAVLLPTLPGSPDSSGDREMSYRELNTRANQLARHLREIGVKPDTIVCLLLERSIEMIIGMLAVLKASGAYLPIDPGYPAERVQFMIEDSQGKVVLTTKAMSDLFQSDLETVTLDDPGVYRGDGSNLPEINTPGHLAYVIYTSGTTGKPKGSLIEHRNVVQLMYSSYDFFDFTSRDTWTMFHSYCFDFSVWEMYGALLFGGKLILITGDVAKDPETYIKIMKIYDVTVLNQTPTSFYHIAEAEATLPGKDLKLKYVIFGGEALKPLKLKDWHNKYPGVKLINMYGITETTVHVTYKEITRQEIDSNISNIGKPISFLETYIVDEHLNLLPIGVPGELCVGGDGVCRGYLNRRQLTGEKFVPNPHKPGQRLYRSGDLAKLTANGEMEYLGRIDHQVKIRGFRIELREIETHLLGHEWIKEAVVIVNEDRQGNKHLSAYIVPEEKNQFNGSELRQFLARKLPEYMVPSHFISLDKIPLTPNGKIDRKALEPLGEKIAAGVEYVAPGSQIEKTIADIWKEVLNLDKVSIHDNFFDIGGHSLDVVKVNTKMKSVFEKDINVATLFRFPTISSLVEYFQQEGTDEFLSDEKIDESVSMMEEATELLFQDDID